MLVVKGFSIRATEKSCSYVVMVLAVQLSSTRLLVAVEGRVAEADVRILVPTRTRTLLPIFSAATLRSLDEHAEGGVSSMDTFIYRAYPGTSAAAVTPPWGRRRHRGVRTPRASPVHRSWNEGWISTDARALTGRVQGHRAPLGPGRDPSDMFRHAKRGGLIQ